MAGVTQDELGQAKLLGREVAENFHASNRRLHFVKSAGVGRHGGALLLQENDEDGQLLRKIIIKYSLGDRAHDQRTNPDDDLINEFKWLEQLRGAEHIAQLLDMAETSFQLRLPGTSSRESADNVPALARWLGRLNVQGQTPPTFALEYIGGGTLNRFRDRLGDEGQWIPNRMLWQIWLCMLRQCVAMAFPPNLPDSNWDGKIRREVIPPRKKFYGLTQNSSHLDNFLFDIPENSEPGDLEHKMGVPRLKSELIDFGRGEIDSDRSLVLDRLGSCYNMIGAASVSMSCYVFMEHLDLIRQQALTLICNPFEDESDLDCLDTAKAVVYTYNDSRFPHRTRRVFTCAPEAMREHEMMDRDLRDWICRCLARDFDSIPLLEDALQAAEDAVATRGPFDNLELAGLMEVDETDEYIREVVQRTILNPS
ncbi:hypothetical protein F5Y15DRAFT_420477 [Xylariaceae sp. FL0016]|nr:hypothetical protein F5Y15DRAFT_420477 [Xylariaceae sp. FL0016]